MSSIFISSSLLSPVAATLQTLVAAASEYESLTRRAFFIMLSISSIDSSGTSGRSFAVVVIEGIVVIGVIGVAVSFVVGWIDHGCSRAPFAGDWVFSAGSG